MNSTTNPTYDAVGNVLTVTDALGTVISYVYDADNRPTQQIDAYGTSLQRTTTTAYDAVGNVQSVTNAVGAVTSYVYDALNRQTQVIEAYNSSLQRTTTATYDAVGNVSSTTNPLGTVTSYGYDALNCRIQEVDALGSSVQRTLTTTYDAVGNVLTVTNGLEVVTSYNYDALNRRVTETDAYGTSLARTLTTNYDADDNVVAMIDALGNQTSYGYDALNRQISIRNTDGGTTTTAYDANDNVLSVTDPLGHTTTNGYDVLNRKTQSTDARGGIVTWTYDANGNLLSLTDPVNNVTQWVYDALDRQVQEIDPLNNSSNSGYDAVDRPISAIDRNGQKIISSYDLLNRKTDATWYDAGGTQVDALAFTYDANDNLLTASNNASMTTRTYDALDRLASVRDSFGTLLTNTYDAADNRTQVQDSFGATTTRIYDVLNRVTSLQLGGTGQTPLREDVTYTARDQVATQTRYSDLAGTNKIGSSTFGYDSVGRLTNLQHLDGSGVNIANYANAFDLAGRITSETLNGGTPTNYTYDATNELTNDSQKAYSYDLNGNRTMPGYTTGPANELTSDGTWNYTFDKNGNLIGKTNPSTGETWSFGYDNRNRLISAKQTTANGVQMQATYVYDAVGHRIEKDMTQSGSTTTMRFAYDRSEIWADLDASNALQTRYVRGEQVLELLARIASGVSAWILADRMGSVRNVTDSTGAVIDTIAYDGYGNVVSEASPMSGGQYKYDGYRYDAETGWYRPDPSTVRYYSSSSGIWTGRDPIQFLAGDSNLYRYLGNAPTMATDPYGLLTREECQRIYSLALDKCDSQLRRDKARVKQFGFGPEKLKDYLAIYERCRRQADRNWRACLNPPATAPSGPGATQAKPCPTPNNSSGNPGSVAFKPLPSTGKNVGKGLYPIPNLSELRCLLESGSYGGQMATVITIGGRLPGWIATIEALPPLAVGIPSLLVIGAAIAIDIEITLRKQKRKGRWYCKCKVRGANIPKDCSSFYYGSGDSETAAKRDATQAAAAEGCHNPQEGFDCGHHDCRQKPFGN